MTSVKLSAGFYAPNLEEGDSKPVDLCAGERGAACTKSKLLEQHVGRCGEQHAKLVRPEAMAAGPVHLQAVLQFLNPILRITSTGVDAVDRLRTVSMIGDDETRIVARELARCVMSPAALGVCASALLGTRSSGFYPAPMAF